MWRRFKLFLCQCVLYFLGNHMINSLAFASCVHGNDFGSSTTAKLMIRLMDTVHVVVWDIIISWQCNLVQLKIDPSGTNKLHNCEHRTLSACLFFITNYNLNNYAGGERRNELVGVRVGWRTSRSAYELGRTSWSAYELTSIQNNLGLLKWTARPRLVDRPRKLGLHPSIK